MSIARSVSKPTVLGVSRGIIGVFDSIPPNLISFPSEFNTAFWTAAASAVAVTADVETAPDGTLADKLYATAVSSSHALQKTAFAVESGKSYRFSIDAKPNGYNYLGLLLANPNAGKYFNVASGAVLGNFVGAPSASAIEAKSSGFYRCSIDFTASSTTTVLGIYLSSTGSNFNFAGDGSSGLTIARAYFGEI